VSQLHAIDAQLKLARANIAAKEAEIEVLKSQYHAMREAVRAMSAANSDSKPIFEWLLRDES
jgi:hypothetical protein